MPKNAELEIFDLEGIPPFNQDSENCMPEKVKEFRAKIEATDAILISTPEYNHSVPGVLKNALDLASRPFGDNSFDSKPVAIMSASPGITFARHCAPLTCIRSIRPEVIVTFAAEKIDEKGKLIEERSRQLIRELLENLIEWTRKLAEE